MSATNWNSGESGSPPAIETVFPMSCPQRQLLMLYVNMPFCRSKCSFCDYVQPIPTTDLLLTAEDSTRRNYIKALCEEIRVRASGLRDETNVPYAIYWGGGTASNLEGHEITTVMTALMESFDLSAVVEATIECSPDTVDPEKLSLFRQLGFNRFSAGVQSFDDIRLRALGRRHTVDDARRVVSWARDAKFENLNIDIMCGFPDETLDEVRHTVTEALKLEVDHLSLYPFRPTPGTALRRLIDRDSKELYLRDQKLAFSEGRKLILNAGYTEYASGYFGRPSVFALMYFQMRAAMIGFGSGAMSIFDRRFRTHTKGRLREYIAHPTEYDIDLPASADPVVISNLRAGLSCFDGILRTEWRHATGTAIDEVLARPVLSWMIDYLRRRGLVEDLRGLRLPSDKVGDLLIDLTFRLLAQTPNESKLVTIPVGRRRASQPPSAA